MIRRQGSHGEGTWSFPGGKLETGERWEDCAKRETREEVRLDIDGVEYMTATNDVFPEGPHYITLFVKANEFSGTPSIGEPDKATDIGWFHWDELPEQVFLPIRNLKEQGFNP